MSDSSVRDTVTGRVRVLRDLALVGIAVLVGVIAHVLWASHHMRVEVTRDTLSVRGDVLGPRLLLAALSPELARVVDPRNDPQLRVAGRIFGGGFAGYRSGWFRLADGSKAQVFLRDGERAVYVPTRQGYGLMVSAPDAEAVLRALKRNYDLSRD